jgi:putative ABC transport system permease protein
MFQLALTNILRRPLRSVLTTGGIAVAVAVVLSVEQLGASYRTRLMRELSSMGLDLMLVPLGCPYDAAARVLRGNALETSLPETVLRTVQADPDVVVAAPLLIAAMPRQTEDRIDMFVGLDTSALRLRPWWRVAKGANDLSVPNAIILGADAAQTEMREPGDLFYSPETQREFRVAGILERSGTSDDSLFFVPLRTAQEMFESEGRLTAVAVRLRDPADLSGVAARLGQIPGAQVVTETEMRGTLQNILGTVRSLLRSIAWVAAAASVAGLVNTLLMSVAERAYEFSLFRAIGASKWQLMAVVSLESVLLTLAGLFAGVILCAGVISLAFQLSAKYLGGIAQQSHGPSLGMLVTAAGVTVAAALLASFYPAIRAARVSPAAVLKGD